MLRVLFLLGVVFAVSACQETGPDDTSPPSAETGSETVMTGRDAYVKVCAECHDEGKDDAPRIGDPDAWVGRSSLWEAVLFEHAEEGFFDMPPRGSDVGISDDTVSAAAEYMLEITHPDRPSD